MVGFVSARLCFWTFGRNAAVRCGGAGGEPVAGVVGPLVLALDRSVLKPHVLRWVLGPQEWCACRGAFRLAVWPAEARPGVHERASEADFFSVLGRATLCRFSGWLVPMAETASVA